MNQQIPAVRVNKVEPKAIKFHPQSQCLLYTPVHLALVVVLQVAAVKIPTSQDRRSPIWPWLLMMMSSLMTHTRSFLLRMPSLFLSFQGRAWKGLIGVTFYQQRSLHFEESTTISQVMSGLATPVHLPGISLWIVKDTWP